MVDLHEAGPALRLERGEVTDVDGPRQWIRFDRRQTSAAELIAELTAAHSIRDLTIEEPQIEDLIRRIYGGG